MSSGWRWFRGRSTRFQVAGWIVTALIVLGVLGSLGGGSSTTANSDPAPASTQAPETTTPPTSTTTPEPADTGRMSDDEYGYWNDSLASFANEEQDFGYEMATKCRTLLLAVALSDASDCIHDAWEGTWDKGLALYDTTSGLLGDTKLQCRASLKRFRSALSAWATSQDLAVTAGENLDFATFSVLVKSSVQLGKPYRQTRDRVEAQCLPT